MGVQSPTGDSMDRNLEAAPIARSRGVGPALGAATGVRDREPLVALAARGDTVAHTDTTTAATTTRAVSPKGPAANTLQPTRSWARVRARPPQRGSLRRSSVGIVFARRGTWSDPRATGAPVHCWGLATRPRPSVAWTCSRGGLHRVHTHDHTRSHTTQHTIQHIQLSV
jgi:hypothetical protein